MEEHGALVGEILDKRYRLVRPLARVTSGGCVYVGQHVRTRKWCALKVLDRGTPDRVRKRMHREMEALATVQGPGVVDFLDAGETEGRLFMVLELLEGRTLAGLLAAKGRLEIGQAVRLVADIAMVLAHCHARGIVHRDVKPANVFVTTTETVRLLDFGIAKLLEERPDHEKLTLENTIVGTPEYMAPEALLMSPDVDARADQYALGILLYECLSGSVPFEGGYADVLRKVSSTPIPPMHLARPDVPISVDRIIKRALSRNPDDRYATMKEMCEALQTPMTAATPTSLFSDRARRRVHELSTLADAPSAKARAGTGRRRHARAAYVTLARLTHDDRHIDGRIEEISESGFQFVGARPVEDGARVVVRFALPVTGKVVETTATSRWNRSTRGLVAAGFEFTTLSDAAIGEVRKYVSIMCSD
jgi:serine/threonine protein kinase